MIKFDSCMRGTIDLWRRALACLFLVTCLAYWNSPDLSAAEQIPPGREIYEQQCARCHGTHGEGVKDHYDDPLQGNHSLGDLVEIISDTMPEDEPEMCSDKRAESVARYVYDTFYTEAARARHRPPRIALSRMTVRQYENAVADLAASFLGSAGWGKERGLKAVYFNARNFRGDKKALERVDPSVDFDFQEGSPDPKKIGKEEFSVRWEGGVIAEDTGEYEFCLQTENGARLWVNDSQKPLIDAWVQSGDDREHTGSLRLLGGRVYHLRLDFFKFKQKTASVRLQWKPPHRVREVIPLRRLVPGRFPRVLVVGTAFPPDDSSAGYERGTSVSPSWDEAATYAAIELANKVVDNIEVFSGTKSDSPDRKERLREFAARFAERAFRRPLSDQQREFYVDRQFEASQDLDAAVKRSVLLVLKSPRFLYVGIGSERLDDYQIASRLSFGLWDSLPDADLLQAAAGGKLHTEAQIEQQARRMVDDFRARSKLLEFLHKWLKYDRAEDLSKDKTLYPRFDAQMASDLRASLDLFLNDVVWRGNSDFRQLLLSNRMFANKHLADYYGLDAPAQPGFHKVPCDSGQRAGVLTHPFLMAAFAYHKSSSPIHRGVFIVRSLVGRSLKPPPIAVAPLDEGENPDMTTRERVALQTRPAACQSCHSMINPLGFTLEHYDAVGRYRESEKRRPVDASGLYRSRSGEVVRFNGARELADFLARSEEVHRSFVEQLFQYLVKQPIAAYGPNELEELAAAFARTEFNIRSLMVEIMKESVRRTNKPAGTEGA